jgi:hypothetical protein
MLRPGWLLALSLTGTFVDTLLRTDFAIRKYPTAIGIELTDKNKKATKIVTFNGIMFLPRDNSYFICLLFKVVSMNGI